MSDVIKVTLEIADPERTREMISRDPRTFGAALRDTLSGLTSGSDRWTLENEYGVRVVSTTTEYGK